MNILFYYPDKEKSVSLSSLMIAFKKQGHTVHLLTHAIEGDLHADVKKHGVTISTHQAKASGILFYLKHVFFLASFVRKQKIDLVYSHIQRANLIACLAQYISGARYILCRHHSDCAYIENNRNEKRVDRIINFLGKEFIVPSNKVLDQMLQVEKVRNKKIYLIRYAYDFSEYARPETNEVQKIKQQYPCRLLLVKIARLIPEKRHSLLINAMKQLIDKGLDIKLLLLSDGPERENISSYITQNGLQNHIFMVGYRQDVVNYIAAADLVMHVSESEASSNLAKEVGLLKKPLVVCKDVGDFDEYLVNKKNCFMIDKTQAEKGSIALLHEIYDDPSLTDGLGKSLHDTVIERFSIETILEQYKPFHS